MLTKHADARRTQTPNATMTTLASPTQGATRTLSLWRVTMSAGQRGPRHAFDTEQLWTVLKGTLEAEVDDVTLLADAGDTLVLPAGAMRRLTACTDAEALVAGHARTIVRADGEPEPRGTPPWIA